MAKRGQAAPVSLTDRPYYKQWMRKRIETAFSRLTAMSPRHIHATGFRGFLLKVSWLIIAFALGKAFN